MLHLPGLAKSKELSKMLRGLGKLHLTARGLNGEGSEATGHLYQISNQRTLGHDNNQLVAKLNNAIHHIAVMKTPAEKR